MCFAGVSPECDVLFLFMLLLKHEKPAGWG